MSEEGGAGKKKTTVNLGPALSELGKRRDLIDLDPQAHLTINYGLEPSAEMVSLYLFFTSRRRHTKFDCDWSSDVCSSDLSRGAARRTVRAAAGAAPVDAAERDGSCPAEDLRSEERRVGKECRCLRRAEREKRKPR